MQFLILICKFNTLYRYGKPLFANKSFLTWFSYFIHNFVFPIILNDISNIPIVRKKMAKPKRHW